MRSSSHYAHCYNAKTGICEISAKRRIAARTVIYPFCTFVPFTSIARFINEKCNPMTQLATRHLCRDRKTHSCMKKLVVKSTCGVKYAALYTAKLH